MGERQFGPYRLVRQIAVGGMAEIHLAKTRGIAGFEKFVALKMIHPNFAQDEQFIQMLIDEAKIAVQLQHVNIAQTFDLGRVGETYYITMEYVDGADLYKLLRRGSEQDLDMPLDVCAYVAKEMATGLDHAHRKRDVAGNPLGIVHRDVSPQNVLISYAGEVKLVDFGIAKATMRARQTQVGVIKGKYYYMSPEQAWGDPLDHRSDIFSCGIVLYEMITGQMLYLEEDLHKLLDMVRRADIAPPRTLRKDVPPQLERIVMHALEKRPADRYQSAVDFATDLERFLHTYSPVFTATKLTAHLRHVVGDPVALIEPQDVTAPRSPDQATQPIDRRELVSERSEITDENSVIFRVDELQGAPRPRRAPTARPGRGEDESTAAELPRGVTPRPRPPTAPIAPPGRQKQPTQPPPLPRAQPQVPTRVPAQLPTRVPANIPTAVPQQPTAPARRPPMKHVSTMTLEATDLAEIEEMTAVSSPPQFGDFEPTMIEREAPAEPSDADDGPTITRDGAGVPLPQPVQLSSSETMPRPSNDLRSKIARGAPAHPALAASTPTPAVSELRRRRESRRTPPRGNVLQEIVGRAGADPMPTVQLRSSDGVPRVEAAAPSASTTAAQPPLPQPPPWPVAEAGPPPGAPPPGQTPAHPQQHAVPQPYQPPGIPPVPPANMPLTAPPTPPPGAVPMAHLPPHLVPYGGAYLPPAAQVVAPGPYPYGAAQPMSFTKQMQAAIDLDDIPQRYKLQENRSRRVVWAVTLALLFAGGIGLAVLLTRAAREAPRAALVIESMPQGATVSVDGARLDVPTPARFPTEPGARHEIEVTAPRHTPWKQAVVVPSSGGDVKVVAVLAAKKVKLRINSQPGGAEIWINGELQGTTPKVVEDLDPEIVKSVELRLKDYAPEVRPLDWGDRDAVDVDVKFRK